MENLVIIGAGPAGLGAAYELAKRGVTCTVFDKNNQVGGLARTFEYKGFRFDVGPHRFYTKNDEVNRFWHEILGKDFIPVKRLTRIYYRGKFFQYPIQPLDAFLKLGLFTSTTVALSYLKGGLFRSKEEPKNFEEWMIRNFGKKLYEIFFKTYTEKVWGIPCRELGPEWANQRIKNLNLWEAVKNALWSGGHSRAKSLIEQFHYPHTGAGMLYERMKEIIEGRGSRVHLGTTVKKIHHRNGTITGLEAAAPEKSREVPVSYLFSSAPITFFVQHLHPKPPVRVLEAAAQLYYRDHITVNLVINRNNLFPDQWIYIHDPAVRMARVANYVNFSSAMSPTPHKTPLSVEYFAFADKDDLWEMNDKALIDLALRELTAAGLITRRDTTGADGFVVREKDSYPTYYTGHKAQFDILKEYASRFTNLQLIGRAGMYKYNNQDHALLTGFLAARNFLGEKNDIWSVNAEDEYLETQYKP